MTMLNQLSVTPTTLAPAAKRSSFYLAMRILPREQREAMYAVYAFCRAVDDIADDRGPQGKRLALLDRWRADIVGLYNGAGTTALTRGVAPAVRRFGLRRQDFLAIIDGMEMDVRENIQAPDFVTLDLYCDRVASAVGRLSVRVFRMPREEGRQLAEHLGRALQLTNILRDLDEDAAIHRLYLPQEFLRDAGIARTDPEGVLASPALPHVCDRIIALARWRFEEADKIMHAHPRRMVRTPRVMSEAYKSILAGLVARGWAAPRERVRLSKSRIAMIVLRHFII